MIHDVCMPDLDVTFLLDRAGLVGEDGETHHGVFDVGFLRHAPGLKILCPGSCRELQDMLCWAVNQYDGPAAIRYPRGGDRYPLTPAWEDTFGENGGLVCCRMGKDATIITYGPLTENAMAAAELLEKQGVSATVLRLLTLSPMPYDQIASMVSENPLIVIMEEVSGNCGIGDALSLQLFNRISHCKVHTLDLGKRYVTHGSLSSLYSHCGLDGQSVADFILEVRSPEN